jgi:hypothetical protein
VEGTNIRVELTNARGQTERLPQLAQELLGYKPDVIVTGDSSDSLRRPACRFFMGKGISSRMVRWSLTRPATQRGGAGGQATSPEFCRVRNRGPAHRAADSL